MEFHLALKSLRELYASARRLLKRHVAVHFLKRLDRNEISSDLSEIRLFSIMRNELVLLPFFLEYYRRLGVSRFFIVDNNSTDGSREYLAQQKDVHLFHSKSSFARWKVAWTQGLLDKYGLGHWCVLADADEFLVYPKCETVDLVALTNYLDQRKETALFSILVDMYSNQKLSSTHYKQGSSPIDACPYFDSDTYYHDGESGFDPRTDNIRGGVRQRFFGVPMSLNKIPLFRNSKMVRITLGHHFVYNIVFAQVQGAVLHFKLFSNFFEKSELESRREEYWQKALEYKKYVEVIAKNSDLQFCYPGSLRYIDSNSLLSAGLIYEPSDYGALVTSICASRANPV